MFSLSSFSLSPHTTDLLPSAGSQEPCRLMSPGQRFMTDLLVGSLMADGGLEATLDASIKIEMRDIEEKMIEGRREFYFSIAAVCVESKYCMVYT